VPIILSAILALPALLAAQEPVTITGKVTSDAGLPLGQVEVAIPTMGLGGLSRDDGSYVVVVPGARVSGQTATIVARRLGYKSQSAQVTLTAGAATHDFTLAANPLQLGEVVVTGAGTSTSTEKLGNVRNHVDADLISRASESNAVEALAGKAPNVTVVQQSGDPGASSFINIRGINSILGANDPLFIVDGVPVDNATFSTSNFNRLDDGGGTAIGGGGGFGQTEGTVVTNRASDINPNDIESVEILKGPAASAIYGARAAAGVILITTKSGRSGPTHFTFRSSTSLDDVNHTYPLQTSWSQGDFGVHADTAGGQCNVPKGFCRRSWGAAIPAGTTVYDHASDIYHMGTTLDNGFTVSGGNDRTTFYLSGDNVWDKGVFVGPNNSYSRTTVRAKASHRILDNLKLGADLSFADSRAKYIQRGNNVNGVQLGDLRTPPEFNNQPYLVEVAPGNFQHRSYLFQHPTATSTFAERGFDNPFFVIYQDLNTANVGRVYGNVNAEYLPTAWLKINYTLGADYATDERLEGLPISSSSFTGGRVVEGKIVNYQIDHNLTATATYTLNADFGGTVTLGQNLNTRNNRQLGGVGRDLIAAQPFKLSNTVTRDLPLDNETVIHDASWFGQGTLDIKSQVYLSAAIRNDGSSTFGRSNLRSWFPKGSLAWEFTKAIGEQVWLSYGKARVAYGEAGVEPVPYLTSQNYTSDILGGIAQGTGNTPTQNGIGGIGSSTTKAAASLKPERTKEFEAGVDLGFFKDRGDASITWYSKKSQDVILPQPLAPSTGFLRQGANAASIQNRGWEVSINVRPVQMADYGWEVGLQWARNRNKVLDLGGVKFIPIGDFNNQVAMLNQPIGVYLGSGFLRCGVSKDSNVVDAAGTLLGTVCAGKPTGALFISGPAGLGPAGFPLQDPDLRIVQDPNYNWTGSVRSGFRYRKFQISGLVDIRHGGQIWNGTKGALWSYGTHLDTQQRASCTGPTACTGNTKTFGQGGWWDGPVVGPGAGTAVPIGENWFKFIAACPFIGIDEPCIESGGFVKLREVSVAYTLDAPWVQRTIGFSSIDVRVTGRNLKTWTKYTGYDPETSLGGAISSGLGAGGVDYFNNPQTRSFVFAITLNH
jgi:TonB-linked SusC/RagA family outer membrane protein